MEKKRVYIVVKTYPTISEEYSELVCTAGIQEDGSWIRLYPVPFRKLNRDQKYRKFTWIETLVERNKKDPRPESYRPNLKTISAHPPPRKIDWDERRNIIFRNQPIYTNLKHLITKAKTDGTSLAVFKPTKVLNFHVKETERNWDPVKLANLELLSKQLDLFQTMEEITEEFKVVTKIPYKFSYQFEDDSGEKSNLMIEDWEIGMLYLNCLRRAKGDESLALNKVRGKYFGEFLERDLHLFVGTTLKYHYVAPNPFIIVGVFAPPPPSKQLDYFGLD